MVERTRNRSRAGQNKPSDKSEREQRDRDVVAAEDTKHRVRSAAPKVEQQEGERWTCE